MATLPESSKKNISLNHVDYPTNTYIIDPDSQQIIGMDNGLSAMRQAIEIILSTERFHWQIYDSNFGIELQDLPGEEYDYIQSELPRRIEEAFSVDSRILSVENYQFFKNNSGELLISFQVITVYGTIYKEVRI